MESRMLKPTELCDVSIGSGCGKANLTVLQQTVLGIMAGIFIALGGAAATVASHSLTDVGLSKFVAGIIFPVGLILVVMCGAELFTGNALMVVPLMDGKLSLKNLIRNWVVVYIANFMGSVLIAFLVFQSGLLNLNAGKLGATVVKVASTKGNLPFWTAFSSAILCNLLVCLAVWGTLAAKDVIGKIAVAWFPIMAFVVCGFEHCVANMYFLSIGMFAKSNAAFVQASGISADKIISGSNMVHNLIPVTLGNIVGGAVLVGVTYYMAYKYTPETRKYSDGKISNMKAN